LAHVNFLRYAKFMHFDAIQYISLLFELKYKLFYSFAQMYMAGKMNK